MVPNQSFPSLSKKLFQSMSLPSAALRQFVATRVLDYRYKKYLRQFGERDDDTYVVTWKRSGSTLAQSMLYQLLRGEEISQHLLDAVPWIRLYAEMKWKLPDVPSPRIVKSCEPQESVRKGTKGRFIYIVRDGRDSAASAYHYFKDFVDPNITFEQFFARVFLNDAGREGWFQHVVSWFENRNNFDILYLRFEDLVNKPDDSIGRIIKFCNIERTQAEIEQVRKNTRFAHMKKRQEFYGPPNSTDKFIRKGKIGEGSEYFAATEQRVYMEKFERYLSTFDLLKEYNPSRFANTSGQS